MPDGPLAAFDGPTPSRRIVPRDVTRFGAPSSRGKACKRNHIMNDKRSNIDDAGSFGLAQRAQKHLSNRRGYLSSLLRCCSQLLLQQEAMIWAWVCSFDPRLLLLFSTLGFFGLRCPCLSLGCCGRFSATTSRPLRVPCYSCSGLVRPLLRSRVTPFLHPVRGSPFSLM